MTGWLEVSDFLACSLLVYYLEDYSNTSLIAESRICSNAGIINCFFPDRHWSNTSFSDCNHKLSPCCSLFNQMHWRMFADSPRWSWELAVLCLSLDHEKQQTHTQTWKSVLQSINRIIILRLSGSVRHIKANISHERMSMLSRTREESGLQQRRGESSLVKKLHQSHVLQLVTQRHWRHKEKQISDDRNQKRERERRVSVLKQPTALKHFYKATTLQWIHSYLTGRGFPVSASSSSQLVQPDGCDPSWPHLKLWHLVMDEDKQ